MTDREAREILETYARTTFGGIAMAVSVVLDADRKREQVYARLETEFHRLLKMTEGLNE